jgi:RES domain-containing protein
MLLFRVGRLKYARDLSGEGSRLKGGRWNHKGIPCVYTSSSRALAVLEYTANVNIDEIPRALCMITIKVSDKHVAHLPMAQLPGNWKETPTPASTKDFGTNLLLEKQYSVLQLPSVIIPEEYNFVLNPMHPASMEFEIADISDFVYDLRIKLT